MLTVETIGRVRREFHVKGKKIKAIARELRVSRNTVRRIVRGDETVHRYARQEQPLPQLGTHVAALEEMLAANAGKPQLNSAREDAPQEEDSLTQGSAAMI